MNSNLKLLFFGIYTFSSFNTNLSSIYYSLFLDTLTLAFFIFSTAFTTSLSFNFLIFLIISFFAPSINNCIFFIVLIFNYSFFNITWFLLSLSTPSAQSVLLLKLSACPILLPATCFKEKSNLDKYKVYLACL